MAILASANWYIRAGGNALNGGGWDSAISGAGTNYCDQDSPQLSLTDLATSGVSDTVTSATAGFTSNMVGNCLRIASGTNFTAGYYFIITYISATSVTLDRNCSTGVGASGVGRIGGAFASLSASLSTGGSVTAPTLTSPLAAGHTINIRGAGTDNPASADYTQTGYAQYPAGDTTNGRIRIIGYNGRPRIDPNGLCFYQISFWALSKLMFKLTGSADGTNGVIRSTGDTIVSDIRVDQAGYDLPGIYGMLSITNCSFINSGSTSAGTSYAIESPALGGYIRGNLISGWRGGGITTGSSICAIVKNVINGCKSTTTAGIAMNNGVASQGGHTIGNAIYGCASDGIKLLNDSDPQNSVVINNIIYGNGGYGINAAVGGTTLNDRRRSLIDYNSFGNNTSGAINGISAGTNDITLTVDPFTNAAGGDFSLNNTAGGGVELRGAAFPQTIH